MSIAPSIVFVTGGWSRSGLFSLKCGGLTATPSIIVIPGALSSEGIRSRSCGPRSWLAGRGPIAHARGTGRREISPRQRRCSAREPRRRPIHRAGRVAKVEDAVRVEIRTSVAVHVHPHLDDADELQEVDRVLTVAVSHPDGPCPRGSRRRSLGETYHVVAVLVDATPRVGDDQRAAVGQSDRQRAQRPESLPATLMPIVAIPWEASMAATAPVATCWSPACRRSPQAIQLPAEGRRAGTA